MLSMQTAQALTVEVCGYKALIFIPLYREGDVPRQIG
jgi:hypothetical protein